MTFEEYQKISRKSVVYPEAGKNLIFPVLGLCGESGEIAEKVKKLIRDKNSRLDEKIRRGIAEELGDVLWYISQISSELELPLEDIVKINLEKISSRKERGAIHGEGDNR